MHFEGVFNVKAPREKVFSVLMDPKQVSQCMPGLQSLEVRSPDDYTAVVRAGVSFIKGDFAMHFTVVEKNPPAHAKLMARGTGIGSALGPVMKIGSNPQLARSYEDLDIDAGTILEHNETLEEVGRKIFQETLDVASGRKLTRAEESGFHHEFKIWEQLWPAL